jgi:hypothetical protein
MSPSVCVTLKPLTACNQVTCVPCTCCCTGLCLLGMGFLLSYQISGAYYSRLMCYSMPPKEVIVSSFMPMAPMAMTAWALLDLTSAAQAHLPALQGVILGGDDAAIKVLILAVVLMLWGFAVWWLVLAVACVSSCIRQGLPFNLGWWGSVFPVGVFAGEGWVEGGAAGRGRWCAHSLDGGRFRAAGAPTFYCLCTDDRALIAQAQHRHRLGSTRHVCAGLAASSTYHPTCVPPCMFLAGVHAPCTIWHLWRLPCVVECTFHFVAHVLAQLMCLSHGGEPQSHDTLLRWLIRC